MTKRTATPYSRGWTSRNLPLASLRSTYVTMPFEIEYKNRSNRSGGLSRIWPVV